MEFRGKETAASGVISEHPGQGRAWGRGSRKPPQGGDVNQNTKHVATRPQCLGDFYKNQCYLIYSCTYILILGITQQFSGIITGSALRNYCKSAGRLYGIPGMKPRALSTVGTYISIYSIYFARPFFNASLMSLPNNKYWILKLFLYQSQGKK